MGPEFQVVVCNGFRSVRVSTSVIGRGARRGWGGNRTKIPDTTLNTTLTLTSLALRAPASPAVRPPCQEWWSVRGTEALALYAQSQRSECVTVGMKHKHTRTLTYALPPFSPLGCGFSRALPHPPGRRISSSWHICGFPETNLAFVIGMPSLRTASKEIFCRFSRKGTVVWEVGSRCSLRPDLAKGERVFTNSFRTSSKTSMP